MVRHAGAGIAMQQPYRRYCQAAAVAFVLVTLYTVPTKLLQGRLGDDWAHSMLHLGSAALTAYAGWLARSARPARALTWALGVGYFALGCYGWFTQGLLLGSPLAIPLGVADNLFHLLLSVPALAIVLLQLRSARSQVPERGWPKAASGCGRWLGDVALQSSQERVTRSLAQVRRVFLVSR